METLSQIESIRSRRSFWRKTTHPLLFRSRAFQRCFCPLPDTQTWPVIGRRTRSSIFRQTSLVESGILFTARVARNFVLQTHLKMQPRGSMTLGSVCVCVLAWICWKNFDFDLVSSFDPTAAADVTVMKSVCAVFSRGCAISFKQKWAISVDPRGIKWRSDRSSHRQFS